MPKLLVPALVTLLALAPVAWAQDAGRVLSFNGDCFANSNGSRAALKIGDTVHVGDSIEVPEKSKLQLHMVDGSVLGLAPGTRLSIDSYTVSTNQQQRDVKLGLDAGLLHATVTQMTQPSNFEVDTALAVASTRSTDWLIEADPDRTWVAVVEGQISFAAHEKGGPPINPVVVPAGDESEVDAPTVAAPALSDARAVKGKPAPPPRRPGPTAAGHGSKERFQQLIERASVSFGWCQCTADLTTIQSHCLTSLDSCKAACKGKIESFMPNALESCAQAYRDLATGKPAAPVTTAPDK